MIAEWGFSPKSTTENIAISHLFYVVFASSEVQLNRLIGIKGTFSNNIKMNLDFDQCAKLIAMK